VLKREGAIMSDEHDNHLAILHAGEEGQFECAGYRKCRLKSALSYAITLLLAGLPYLLGRWKPGWQIRMTMSKCSLVSADSLMITDKGGDVSVARVNKVDISQENYFPRDYAITFSDDAVEETTTTRLLPNVRPELRYFRHKMTRFVWASSEERFHKLEGLDADSRRVIKLLRERRGLNEDERRGLQIIHGLNTIDVEVKSYIILLTEEVLNPFYVFQIASMILWALDDYVLYASCILFISVVSIGVSVYEIRQQSQALHDMVSSSNAQKVSVIFGAGDDMEEVEIDSPMLVPGDLIAIPPNGCTMSCDAVLISGTCIVNESMLTGESVPVTKSSLAPPADGAEDELFDPEEHKRNTLFAGTSVIQTRYYGNAHVLAVVARTGFSTSKGELVKSILFPKPMGFKFYTDSLKFIAFLFFVAFIGMCYAIYVYVTRGASLGMIVLRCLDIITIVVPPALPAAMTIGTAYAQRRLKRKKIFCLQPTRINVGGKIKIVCFDKTGTLTEDGLDMHSVVGVTGKDGGQFCEPTTDMSELDENSALLACLATCHSLTLIDNALVGDPLDIKMFESTGWEIEEPGTSDTSKYDMLMPTVVRPKNVDDVSAYLLGNSGTGAVEASLPYEVGIIRQFTFSSAVARMSVVTRALGDNHFSVFTKGAPEKLEELCRPETIPPDFQKQLTHFTLQGYRVIGLATKKMPQSVNYLKVQKIKRDVVEKDLNFLGLLVMRNMLKPETTPVIDELKAADIRCVMVTGDNLLTAVSVARDCGMVGREDRVMVVECDGDGEVIYVETENAARDGDDNVNQNGSVAISVESPRPRPIQVHLAMSGKTWAAIKANRADLLPSLMVKGTVFARMAPDQKAHLVEDLQAIDYIVGMCGDGANDCGALKAANVGISLSEAEASVAAPFTSRTPNITCVPDVIREGRCSLVSSFGIFKYMALYSIIQFVSVLILYTMQTNLGDAMFLYIDLVILGAMTLTLASSNPYPTLVEKRPPGSLVSFSNLFCIIVHIIIVAVIQVSALLFLQSMSWYVANHVDQPDDEIILCWETTTIFLVSSLQYIAVAFAFSRGPPFRMPFYYNYGFALSIVILTAFTAAIAVYPGQYLARFLELMPDTDKLKYRLLLLVFPATHLILSVLIEARVAESGWLKAVARKMTGKTEAKSQYKRILCQLEDWPPVVQAPHERGFS
jgi:predicted P-type ATPase